MVRPRRDPTEEELKNMSSSLQSYYRNREQRQEYSKQYYKKFKELYQDYQKEKYQEYKEKGTLHRQRCPNHPRKKYPKKKEPKYVITFSYNTDNEKPKRKRKSYYQKKKPITIKKEEGTFTLTW